MGGEAEEGFGTGRGDEAVLGQGPLGSVPIHCCAVPVPTRKRAALVFIDPVRAGGVRKDDKTLAAQPVLVDRVFLEKGCADREDSGVPS